jgi:hypothetical protein
MLEIVMSIQHKNVSAQSAAYVIYVNHERSSFENQSLEPCFELLSSETNMATSVITG